MTIKQARKILGKVAKNLSDEEVLSDIESAQLLKDIFFDIYFNDRNKLDSYS